MIRTTTAVAFGWLLVVSACGEVKSDAASGDDPKITMLDPDHGPAIGGVMVTVTGSGMSGTNPIVVVDGVSATEVTASSDSTITFKLPPGIEGNTVDVEVSTDHGFAIAPAAFRYNLRPVILDIQPRFGRFSGGTSVTISGRGFQVDQANVPTVTIGGAVATAVQIIDDKTITATTAPADPQALAFVPTDIEVSNANGMNALPKTFSLTKQGIILVSSQTQKTFYFDPTTKASSPLSGGAKVPTCALAPNGKLDAMKTRDNINHDLIEYDPIGHGSTVLAPTLIEGAVTHDIPMMAYIGNTLYVVSRQAQRMYSVNTTSGALTGIGPAPTPGLTRGGITARDGSSLWYVTQTNGTLNSINVATGAITTGPTLSGGGIVGVRALVTVGGVLYLATTASPTIIYTVNTTSGVLTQFASVPAQNVSGMCQTPTAF